MLYGLLLSVDNQIINFFKRKLKYKRSGEMMLNAYKPRSSGHLETENVFSFCYSVIEIEMKRLSSQHIKVYIISKVGSDDI